MDFKRRKVELVNFHKADISGWETVRGIGKIDKADLEGVMFQHVGKSFKGKTLRIAYKDIGSERFWIVPIWNNIWINGSVCVQGKNPVDISEFYEKFNEFIRENKWTFEFE